MKFRHLIFLLTVLLISSCIINPAGISVSSDEYFFYGNGNKIYFKLSLEEVWIEFERGSFISDSTINYILNRYDYLERDNNFGMQHSYAFRAVVNDRCNTEELKAHLLELNRDSTILCATPIFYFDKNDPDSYIIYSNEFGATYNEELTTEAEFIDHIVNENIELISSHYTQYFRVKNIATGFETLEISNRVNEDTLSRWSQPNFYANISLE